MLPGRRGRKRPVSLYWAQIFNFRRPFQPAANGMNAFRRAIFETITFAGIIILAASVSPRIAAQGLVGFKMPSNNIYCMLETPYNDDGLRCDIREVTDSLPPQPASCQFAWGKSFEITPNGSVGTRICISDAVYLHSRHWPTEGNGIRAASSASPRKPA